MKNDLFSIGGITIHGYGLMIGIGILAAYLVSENRAKKQGLDPDHLLGIALWGVGIGLVSAKLLYYITIMDQIIRNPRLLLDIANGFVVYGGLIGGILGGYGYCKRHKLDFFRYADLILPSVALAQGFGRLGCFLAGCCYGRETDSFLGVSFPEGSLAPAGVKLLPTQLFSSAGDFAVMGILLWHYGRRNRVGDTGFLYMLLYGVGRFFLEFLRNDERGNVGSLSTSQFISLFIVTASLFLLSANKRKPELARRQEEPAPQDEGSGEQGADHE